MRFLVFGDSKGKDNGINTSVLNSLMKESKKLDPEPEFIVVLGDSVSGSPDKALLSIQLKNFKNIISSYYPGKIIVPVIGNHEVNNFPPDDRYEIVFENTYSDLLPSGYLDGYNKTSYYMDFRDTRLIILNSFHPGEIHKITGSQISWLKKTASQFTKNKIVFVHSPAFPTGAHIGHCLDLYKECRDELLNILDDCNVRLIFSSHEHNYSRRVICRKNNITQIISGGGGEKLKNKYKSKSGVIIPPIAVFHFVVVDIDDSDITISAISSKGKKLDEFTI